MDYHRLEKNIRDVLEEEQIKLGYRRESVRLYYPLPSLNRLLQVSQDSAGMQKLLDTYFESGESSLGKVEVSNTKNRFCLTIPADGVEAVHKSTGENSFLREFLAGITAANMRGEVHVDSTGAAHREAILHGGDDLTQPQGGCVDSTGAAHREAVQPIQSILRIFRNYSDQVHFEKIENGEFDYLIYFEDGQPDDFRYCITDEGCHLIYHRFTPEDYQDFQF